MGYSIKNRSGCALIELSFLFRLERTDEIHRKRCESERAAVHSQGHSMPTAAAKEDE